MTKFHCQERPNSLSILTLVFSGNKKSHRRTSQAAATHFLPNKALGCIHAGLGLEMLRGEMLPEAAAVGRGRGCSTTELPGG